MTIHADPALAGDARADDLDREYRMLIDGEWVPAADGGTFQCVDPFTTVPWGRVPVATNEQVDQAVGGGGGGGGGGGWGGGGA
jgi:hypothetical protein